MAWGRRHNKESKAAQKAMGASINDVEARAMMLLAMRDHGTQELRQKLLDKHFPSDHVEVVIERFKQYNYLDDARVAQRYVEYLARQSWGPSQIRMKMIKRAYTSQQIDVALEEAIEEEAIWVEHARERLRAKFKKEPHELDQEERQQAWRHLAYRGYQGGIISKSFHDVSTG